MKDISNIYKLYTEANHPELNLANAINCAINLLSDEEILNCKDIKAVNPVKHALPDVTEPEKENKPKQPKEEIKIDMEHLNNVVLNVFEDGDPFRQFTKWATKRSRTNQLSYIKPYFYTPVPPSELDTVIEILSVYISEEKKRGMSPEDIKAMSPEDIKASLKDKSLSIKPAGPEKSLKVIRASDIENALKS
jgi:hypothetical protein